MRLFDFLSRSLSLVDAEEASTFSAYTAPRPSTKQLESKPTKHVRFDMKPTKRVRFDPDVVEHVNEVQVKEDLKDLWYQDMQLKMIQQGTFRLTRRITAECRHSRVELAPYQELMARIYERCSSDSSPMVVSDNDCKNLTLWAEHAPDRIGLEYLSVRSLQNVRSSRHKKLVDLINAAHREKDWDGKVDYIRMKCESISHTSRRFAYAIAQNHAGR